MIRFKWQIGIADAKTEHDIPRAELLAVVELEDKSVLAGMHAILRLRFDEIEARAAAAISKQRRQPIAQVETIVAARGEALGGNLSRVLL